MIRMHSLALTATITLGIGSVAQAQDFGPSLVGGGDDAQVIYAQPSHNVVGSGIATIASGGDDRQITYAPGVAPQSSNGLVAAVVGGGDNTQLVYYEVALAKSMTVTRRGQPRG